MNVLRSRRVLLLSAVGATVAAGVGVVQHKSNANSKPPGQSNQDARRPPPPWAPPTRFQMLEKLKSEPEFDLLVIGGGATGAGVAVDAATRGLKVALVERDDFSSGTSSKSTKLVHGGVRYLQKAVMELDYEQFKLVREALHERKIFLQTAPYLSHSLPIMLPLYKYWQLPYYWAGCKMYDLLAGKENMESSYMMSKGKALEAFPMLKSDGLVGAMVYYDGQHNDSRMNVALVMTAVYHGATVANYAEVTQLQKNDEGRLSGAIVKDTLTGECFRVRAKGVVNATGPFSDNVLSLLSEDPTSHRPIVQPSSGVHITLPNYYSPASLGLIDPQTSDGRIIFFLPWQGNTIAGTTDTASKVEKDPIPKEEEIQWILEEIRTYLSPDIKVRRGDVLSAWSGLRPLVKDPHSTALGTEGLVRSHLINVSPEGLLTIAGGKWTTYRAMAAETVDRGLEEFGLRGRVSGDGSCVTEKVRLLGSEGWAPNMFISLIQRFGLDTEVARHLAMNYGDRAWTVCSYLKPTGRRWPLYGHRLSPQYPFIEAEILYAVHHEYAQTAIDFLSRRSRLSFLNAQAALEALPYVIEVMGKELSWGAQRRKEEHKRAAQQLESMGVPLSQLEDRNDWFGWLRNFSIWPIRGFAEKRGYLASEYLSPTRAIFAPGEVDNMREIFSAGVGSWHPLLPAHGLQDLIRTLPGFENVKEKQVVYVLGQTGLQAKAEFDINEFIEICGLLKEVTLLPEDSKRIKRERRRIPVEKSGGGV